MSDEIDRLEIVVEAEANKANRALSGMEKRLDRVADSLAKVMLLANKGFDMNKFFGTSTGEKKAEQFGKRMADDLIKGFNLDRAGSEVKRQVRNLSNSIANGLYSGGKNKSYISDMDKLGDVIKRNGSVAENVSSDYKELYDTIRAIGKIRISPETAKSLGDDYKDRSGILKSKMSTGTGIELDSIYQELKGRFSDILPDVSNTEDQFYAINDSVREFISLRDQAFRKVNEDEAYEAVAKSVEDLNTELRVAKAESDAFNSSLSEMKSLSESFKFDFSGLESAQKTMDSMVKKPKARKAPSVENADFDKTARSIDDLFDKYGKAGLGIDYSDMGFRELQREQAKMQREARRYSAALDEKISVEQPRELGKAYDKLVYKIQRARNATADLGDEIEKRQRLFRELGGALTQSGGKENSEIDSAIEDSLVDNINWDLMGRTVGAGINTLVNTFNLLFDEERGIKFKLIGEKISTGLRGAIDEIEWTNLGNALGNYFMIAWDFLSGFVSDMSRRSDAGITGWAELGIALGNAVAGVFQKIDFPSIGLTLANGLNGFSTILQNFTNTVPWDEIAVNITTGINNFITKTKWDELGASLSGFVMKLLGTFQDVVHRTDWNAIGVAIGEFLGKIDWGGILLTVGDIIWTAFSGMLSGLFDTGTGTVFVAFVGALALLKGVFGFVDLSTSISEWITKASNTFGGFGELIKTNVVPKVADGIRLITGEGGLFSKIGSAASKVAGLAGKAFTGIGDFITTTAAPAIKTGVDFISGTIFPKISSAASTVVAKAGPILTSIGTKIFSPTGLLIAGIAGGVALIVTHWDEIKDAASKVKDWVGEKWNQVKDWTSKKWSEISTSLSKTWDNLKSWASEKFTNIKDSVSKAWEGAKSATSNLWSSAKKTAGNIWESMKSGASNIFGSIGRKVKETWSGTESDTSKAWSNSKRQVDSSINGIDSSVKSKMNSVKSIVSSTMNQVGNIFESKWRSISSTSTSAIGQMQTSVSQKMGNMKNSISSSMNSIISSYRSNWKSMVNVTKSEMNSCVSVFRSFPSKVSSAMSSMYTVGKNAANSFKRGLQSVHIPTPHMNISSYSKQSVGDKVISIPRFKVKWYAQGGFPNMGELFIANERGPELVGRMGNRNVVANNNQIISGIAEGVGPAIYNAVLAAMSQSVGGKNGDVHITLEIDGGKLVTKIVKKYNEMKGSDPNFGFVY